MFILRAPVNWVFTTAASTMSRLSSSVDADIFWEEPEESSSEVLDASLDSEWRSCGSAAAGSTLGRRSSSDRDLRFCLVVLTSDNSPTAVRDGGEAAAPPSACSTT